MNILERKMLEILKKGKAEYGYQGVKSEFEAEGIRMDEQLRLIELVRRADLNLGIKIGGCEAVSDLYTCKQIGVEYIIAPMIETSYSLSKYIDAKNKVFTKEEQADISFLFNLETITAYNNLNSIIKTAVTDNGVAGVVFGRIDFIGSINLDRNQISNREVTNCCIEIAKICKHHNLDFVLGGAVSIESIDILNELYNIHLTRFETRKVIIGSEAINQNTPMSLKNAIEFESLALKNKSNYYNNIAIEDLRRIKMLEDRIAKFNI